MKYKHSEVFAEVKAIEEDIKINLTSLQYLQILDHFLWSGLQYMMTVSPKFFECFLAKVVAHQQIHAMMKMSSEPRDKLSCHFFNFLTTSDVQHAKNMRLNRGLYFGVLQFWLKKSEAYFECKSVFHEPSDEDGKIMNDVFTELGILDCRDFYAYFRQIDYWCSRAQKFKSQIVQKYVRMTLLQAQKTYVEFNHVIELDDVTQIYLMVMSKAIDRCDSRLGVLTTFIQSWLKSAKAIVQKQANVKLHGSSFEELIEEHGDSVELGVSTMESPYEFFQQLSWATNEVDKTGCVNIMFGIPQFVSCADRQILESYACR